MPSKLRQAIGAVKDQTSIGLAKVSGRASNLEVAILKATSHDEVPVNQRHVTEVILRTKSSPLAAAACVQALSRRISRTSNWIVALKCLVLAFRALRDGGPDFSREALSVFPPRRRRRLLDLSTFCDDSWDFTAFARTYALYLDARLDSALLGKLGNLDPRRAAGANCVANMKLPLILDRIGHWQRLLDRAIATRPTGPAKTNRLVQISLYAVVRESFDLYRDVSDGLSLLLDNFFHLEYPACRESFRACTRAAKQFQELDSFYSACKKVGVGRLSEYPSVRMISKALLKSLEEFLEDHEDSKSTNDKLRSPPRLSFPGPHRQNSNLQDRMPVTPNPERQSMCSTTDWQSVASDQNCLSEGRARATLSGGKHSMEENHGMLSDLLSFHDERRASTASSSDREKGAVLDLIPIVNQPKASTAPNSAQEKGVVLDLVPFDSQSKASTSPSSNSWELVLVESAKKMSDKERSHSINGPKTLQVGSQSDKESLHRFPLNYYNPFLHDFNERNSAIVPSPKSSWPSPAFRAARQEEESARKGTDMTATQQQLLLSEQQTWMQHQRRIIAKNLAR